jgi:SHS2 domain-containing protein
MFKIISHTADVGIRVSAKSLEDLFVEAAKGWKYSVIEDSPTAAKEEREVQLSAANLEDLMVQWLNELNFYLTVQEWILHDVVECQIQSDGLRSPYGLRPRRGIIDRRESDCVANFSINGEPLDYKKHEIYIEIKSVTYHQLEIQKVNNQYKTRIIFDI